MNNQIIALKLIKVLYQKNKINQATYENIRRKFPEYANILTKKGLNGEKTE